MAPRSGNRPTLDRAAIVHACVEIIETSGVEGVTMRRLGDHLGVDATAVYRHFRDKDELLRAVGDHAHVSVLAELGTGSPTRRPWRDVVHELCVRLRAAHLARPQLAALVRTAPPMQEHELRLTETLLRELGRSRLGDDEIVLAYHALIELTVGSAAIDAPMAALDAGDRDARYASWRRTYAALDERGAPQSVRLGPLLYPGDADTRFSWALDVLLDGLAAAARRSRRSVSGDP